MNTNLQEIILRSFFTNEEYMRRVVPFMDADYFEGTHKQLFKLFVKYVAKYNNAPTVDSFKITVTESDDNFSDSSQVSELLPKLFEKVDADEDWLMDKTEKWCQDRAVFNAIMESISIIDGKHPSLTKNALPDILSKALGVSFDANIGHDYLANIDERFDFYHEKEERIPFDLEYFNAITKGGLPNKSLNIVLAGTGVGKSLFMCHCAANCLMQSKNVLYITMEMAEERIAERIDSNLLDIPLSNIESLSRENFHTRVSGLINKTTGNLIIKEYPTGQAHAGHFRALLNELKLKKKFTPDIIYIDYLNICSSSRMKGIGGSINSYSYIKAIAEEIRGLAVEFNVPIVSATQTTRAGFSSSDPGLEDTSESFGLPATADLMIALISNDELAENNQIMVKQLKNRYNDPTYHKRFVIGVDRSKMKLYDVDIQEQEDIIDDTPVFDKSDSGKRISIEGFKL